MLVGVVPEHQALPLGDGTDLGPQYLRYIAEVTKGIKKKMLGLTVFPKEAHSD